MAAQADIFPEHENLYPNALKEGALEMMDILLVIFYNSGADWRIANVNLPVN